MKVVQRLDARTIAEELETLLVRIPDGDGEHAIDVLNERIAPFKVGVEHNLGVRAGAKDVSAPLQVPSHGGEAVDLAVEHEPRAAARREHGLVGVICQIDDRQAPEPDLHGAFQMQPACIGSPVGD